MCYKLIRMILAAAMFLTAGVALADVFNMPSGQTSLQFVTVGDPGNAADTTGFGAVGYTYQIGKYEVTNAQYYQFLNAKLPTISDELIGRLLPNDTYGLYTNYMDTDAHGGINYNPAGAVGAKFSVKSGFENRPVNYTSWYDSVRFINWLQNGQGSGDTESGTYAITGGGQDSGTVTVPDATTRASWANQHWVLPSEDQWYKAAYYDPKKPGGAGYWTYPTKSDTPPINLLDPAGTNNANFDSGDHTYTIGPPYYTTVVGAFADSPSAYNTFDQCGNVWEWNEALIDGSLRGFRGGSFASILSDLPASHGPGDHPDDQYNGDIGFRVASVPEPGSIALLFAGIACLLAYTWRRRKQLV